MLLLNCNTKFYYLQQWLLYIYPDFISEHFDILVQSFIKITVDKKILCLKSE